MILQIRLFAFWKKKAPVFWEILNLNPLSFFEDAGEISLSRLASLVGSNPNQYDCEVTGEAYRFQKIGKLAGGDPTEVRIILKNFKI